MVSHNIAVQTAALTSVMLMCAFICGHLINISKLKNIPQSTAGILIGAFSGLLIFYWNPKLFGNKSLLNFNPELFYMFMLPPIILEAGFSMDRINFIKNFHSIMWLAIGGTLLAAILTAAGLYIPHLLSPDYGFFEGSLTEKLLYCTLLGTLLAAVDPVATLGVLGGSRFEANEKLFSIVFGESLLNDSVSIVLFRTLVKSATILVSTDSPHPWKLLSTTLLSFMYVTLISCIIGAVTGLIAYLAFRLAGGIQRFPEYELGVLLLIAYFSFSVAEMVDGSGIVSLFITAVLLGHYNIKNLSLTSQRSSVLLFKVLSVFSESFIYLLFGTVFTRSVITHAQFDVALVAWTTLLLMVSRAAVVFPSAAIINAIELKQKSYAEEQKETQVLAGACMHAVFDKHPTSRYTPLAKSLCATERPTQDNSSSPYTQFDDDDDLDSRPESARPYRPGEGKAGAGPRSAARHPAADLTPPGKACPGRSPALPQIDEHRTYDIRVVSQSPPCQNAEAPSAPVGGESQFLAPYAGLSESVSRGGVAFRPAYVERTSFVSRLSASDFLREGSPRSGWYEACSETPLPAYLAVAGQRHVNFGGSTDSEGRYDPPGEYSDGRVCVHCALESASGLYGSQAAGCPSSCSSQMMRPPVSPLSVPRIRDPLASPSLRSCCGSPRQRSPRGSSAGAPSPLGDDEAFEDARSVVAAAPFGFFPNGKAEVFARLPGQRIHDYMEELRRYRDNLKQSSRLYTQVLDVPCQVLLWMSGLRGAIAFVLALSVPDLGSKSGTHNRNLIITTTLAIIVFTTVALGSLIEFFALKFNIIRRVDDNIDGFSTHSSVTAQFPENEEWSKAIIEGCKQLWHSLKHSPYRKHTSPLLSDPTSKSRRRCRCNSASPQEPFS